MPALPAVMVAPDSPGCVVAVPAAGETVLQVEDNDCVAGLVAHVLHRSGRRVLRARNGAECERLFREHRFEIALVLLDCRLPDIHGVELGRRLREQCPALPVLFTSGQHYTGPRSFADGATAFIAKPFLPGQLAAEVNALLAGIA